MHLDGADLRATGDEDVVGLLAAAAPTELLGVVWRLAIGERDVRGLAGERFAQQLHREQCDVAAAGVLQPDPFIDPRLGPGVELVGFVAG